jgi:RNA polymerase sigma factor (sigma-70 family)
VSQFDLEHLLRELAPQVLGTLVRKHRDFAAAEDAVQEALLAAATQWPAQGVPDNPRAWLTQVATRRLTDQLRSDLARRRRETEAALEAGYVVPATAAGQEMDDTLVLIHMCCHPSLTTSSAVALTLRAVAGLTTAQIAHAFLVPEATMAQRISRARQTVKDSRVSFRLPGPADREENLRRVLHVLYLIFNEGYTASTGTSLQRSDLAAEAIRLTRLLHSSLPEHPEVAGLLALMLLTDARRTARSSQQQEVIPLQDQDRTLWDRAMIAEGVDLLRRALQKGAAGAYQLQAAIAAVHDEAKSAEDTDWPQIVALYELLEQMSANPMVKLNRAVAVAMVRGPRAGLELLGSLEADERLRDHHRLQAVRGHLLEKIGDRAGAISSYRLAATRTASLPERNYLLAQAARLREVSE